jgi:cellulose synthase operon protein C
LKIDKGNRPVTDKEPPKALVERVRSLYESGRVVDALHEAERFAPLSEWTGAAACTLASRVAMCAGARRLSLRLVTRAWYHDTEEMESLVGYSYAILEHRGPLALWTFLKRQSPTPQNSTAEARAELLALKSKAASDLRDFSLAETCLTEAEGIDPHKPWIRLNRSHLLEQLDRLEEALEVAREANRLHTRQFYRPAIQTMAHLLQLLDRDNEAITLLQEADAELQNGLLSGQLYGLLSEKERWHEAEAALDRYVALSPLIEKENQKWVTAQRARIYYHLGKRQEAWTYAKSLEEPFYATFAKRLLEPASANDRIKHDVRFVRQHFKTCAPATLAALGRYWKLPGEHLALAEAICYDGTAHWRQREWAEQNGWRVQEFRVTYESAVELLRRGIPFALSTVDVRSAHMVAVIGFDRVRNVLYLRDPSQPYVTEVPADKFLEYYRASGPHGMVFIPAAALPRMEGLTLPDAEVYEHFHQLCLALSRYDRMRAEEVVIQMGQAYPEHALSWEAKLSLACYDGNMVEQTACLDVLLKQFPDDSTRLLHRFDCLNGATREERVAFMQKACKSKKNEPALYVELARALLGDARVHSDVEKALKYAFRYNPLYSKAMIVQAELCWDTGKYEEGTEFYRFAAHLEGFKEHLYQVWFRACRRTRRTKEALNHLRERWERFGGRSEEPALTLAWALLEMEQPQQAHDVLVEAAAKHPDEGIVQVHLARLQASLGNPDEAQSRLGKAHGHIRHQDWLRAAIDIAKNSSDTEAILRLTGELLKTEPLDLNVHADHLVALSRLHGQEAALKHLKTACEQFPHHSGLKRLLIEWGRMLKDDIAEQAARELLERTPSDAWTRREWAIILRTKQIDEAIRQAEEAARIEPFNSYGISLLGYLYQSQGRPEEAVQSFRRAVELSVDNSEAMNGLLNLAQTDAERKKELCFLEQQLISQVVFGDGLLTYLSLARPILEADALLESVKQAHKERPDLWHSWSALISQLDFMGRFDEALTLAKEATTRFAHLPRIWLDLSYVYKSLKEPEHEIEAATEAFEINPAWTQSALVLAGALERHGKMSEAMTIYSRALHHLPNDPQLHACRAHLLWQQREPEQAFQALEKALHIAPDYDWAWSIFKAWTVESGSTERLDALLRSLTRERPGEAAIWLQLAKNLSQPTALPERLEAIDKALALSPRHTEAWDLKAELLTSQERFEKAIEACHQGEKACPEEAFLFRGRLAWIEAQRQQIPEAIRQMRAVLTDNASYAWGWNRLVDWLVGQNELSEAADALQHLQRLNPHNPWHHYQLGILRLRQSDTEGAKQAFTETLRLNPNDVQAAYQVFRIHLDTTHDLEAADQVIALMKLHQPSTTTEACSALLHLRRGYADEAAALFEKLCQSSDPDNWPIEVLTEEFNRFHRRNKAVQILKTAIKQKGCHPQVGFSLIQLLLKEQKMFSALLLFLHLPAGEMQRRVAPRLMEALGDNKRGLLVRWALNRRREVFLHDDEAWGQAGRALYCLNRFRAAEQWLSDWATRKYVQPWSLFNYCLVLRGFKKYREAHAVAAHAVKALSHRPGARDLHLFLAIDEALEGNITEAEHHLQQANVRQNVDYDQDLCALTKGLIAFHKLPQAERASRFMEACQPILVRFTIDRLSLGANMDVNRAFRKTGRLMMREGGGWRAKCLFIVIPYGYFLFIFLALLVAYIAYLVTKEPSFPWPR